MGRDGEHYTLGDLLGQGGMGYVHRARDNALRRDVALKFLSGSRDERSLARFMREARAYTGLSHPNIVKVLDVGEMEGRPFIAMELIDAVDLARKIEREGPCPIAEAVSIVDQVLDALEYCHGRGFVHRDVKPSNIMLDGTDRAILMDFGQVKHADFTVLTEAGSVMGTPRYMAPEVARGGDHDALSDLWSLGTTAWELLAGRKVFEASSMTELIVKIETGKIDRLDEVRPEVGPHLSAFVGRFLERDRSRRWPDAAAARRDLARSSRRLVRPPSTGPIRSSSASSSGPAGGRRVAVGAAIIFSVMLVGLAVLKVARPAAPVGAPAAGPLPSVRLTYPSFDRLEARFETVEPSRWWASAGGARSVEPSPVLSHLLVLEIVPGRPVDDVRLGPAGEEAVRVSLPAPPHPVALARRLVRAVRTAGFTDEAVKRAFGHMKSVQRKRHADNGPVALSRYVREDPSSARPVDLLVDRLRGAAGLVETYRDLSGHLEAYLGSRQVSSSDRWALIEALDRLEAHDILATYLGRPRVFDPWSRTAPALEIRFESAPLTIATTFHQGAKLPVPPVDGLDPPRIVVPSREIGSYHLYVKGEAPPPSFETYQVTISEMGTDIPNLKFGEELGIARSRPTRGRGAAIQLLLNKFQPQMALRLEVPGASSPLMLRRPLSTFGEGLDTFLWCTVTFRKAMVPSVPGRWRLRAAWLFCDTARPNVRIDRVIIRGIE